MRKPLFYLLAFILFFSCNTKKIEWTIFEESDSMIFPSTVLSSAQMNESDFADTSKIDRIGNQKSWFAISMSDIKKNTHLVIKVKESPFWEASETQIDISNNMPNCKAFPLTIWKYEALKSNNQSTPVELTMELEIDGKSMGSQTKTFTIRSINECLYGAVIDNQYEDYSAYFAAYVNEDHPVVDQILKEGLQTGIVNAYIGYQGTQQDVYNQIASLWDALQKREIKYSSITESSQTSNKIFSQRVRLIDDALNNAQANCVDGSVLFASLIRAIGLHPVLVKIPGHMFLGFYLDEEHKEIDFLETTMLGSITQNQANEFDNLGDIESINSFNAAVQMGRKEFNDNKDNEEAFTIDIKEARELIKPISH